MKLGVLRKQLDTELSTQFNERERQQLLAILFEKKLGLNRAKLALSSDLALKDSDVKWLQDSKEALLQHMPIDYVVNQSVFFGREFYVDERVLIPRSETEELVQLILENENTKEKTILDIGSGSGCIPITLKLEGGYAQVDACEISIEANEVAIINATNLGAEVSFSQLDILTQIPQNKYDIVVSNPPYVKQEELEGLDKNVVEFEPVIALAPEGEPLTFYKRMIEIAPQMFNEGGKLYWEIHEDLGKEVVQLLLDSKTFEKVKLIQDMYGRDRIVTADFIA